MCFATQHRALFEHLNFQKCYISTSKSAPSPTVFSTLDFDMCFAPQRNALFSTAQLPKSTNGPRPSVFSLLTSTCAASACTFLTALLPKVVWDLQFFHFWLPHVLRAAAACTFSTSQLPKVLRQWRVLHILTSKFAPHHSRVQFFHLSSPQMAPHPPL